MAGGSTTAGIGFPSLLFIVFLVLKLTHTINWSWWWVTAPIWMGAGLWIFVVGLLLLIVFILDKK